MGLKQKTNIPSPLYFVVQYAFTLTVTDTETDKNGLCMVVSAWSYCIETSMPLGTVAIVSLLVTVSVNTP